MAPGLLIGLLLVGRAAALVPPRAGSVGVRERVGDGAAAALRATREQRLDLKERRKSAPQTLSDDLCLVPGEVVVRVDVAPGNARRIYTGVDINADVETVWGLLTDYEGLADVVPNLVKNEVLSLTGDGARLKQVGSAQVLPGVNFRASMVLDVTEVLGGLPSGKIRRGDLAKVDASVEDDVRTKEKKERLERGLFPRP